jgi:hypothetical protein
MTEDCRYTEFIGDKLNYLNHDLILNNNDYPVDYPVREVYMYDCKKCNIVANCFRYDGADEYHYVADNKLWKLLELTCDEIIIKRLLE